MVSSPAGAERPLRIAPLAVIAATVATAVYIAADDDEGEPISPF